MTSRKGKTSYPTGGKPWAMHIYQWLSANPDTSQAELARRVGIRPATLNQMLKGKVRQSHAVPSINQIVGYKVETMAAGTTDETDTLTQIAAMMSQLDEDDEDAIREQLESVRKMAARLLKKRDPEDS
jgi:DNA-binding transcriptional regulator YdaS (Cro superfamily)